MTTIKPFKAVTYNQQKFKNFSQLVCPPYDVISPESQEYYHQLSPYNLIHILLGKDIEGEDKYKRAGIYFRNWLKRKILIQDDVPAIYFYSHQYNLMGEKKNRLGFIALLRLKDRNAGIYGHEHTHLEPKEDRLRILKQVKANLSPIFVTFPDKQRIINRTYQTYIKDRQPYLEVFDKDKNNHKLWRITDRNILERIRNEMKNQYVFIADGHHRYEVACIYRKQMRKKHKKTREDRDYNYILAYFTSSDSRSLSILPVHRLLKLDLKFVFDNFKGKLKEYFHMEEIKDKARFFFWLQKGGRTEHVFGMHWNKKFWLLRLKNIKLLDKMLSDKPKEYRSVDVAILNRIILEKILKVELEDKEILTFSPNANELIESVDNQSNCLTFILNPVRIEQIIEVSLQGERMPPKSTYFYPKVLSGLVINKFNEG